jgi:lipopolysaccharide/colanic/teichoic acid biosynthesis glycosyltransferase
MNKDVFALDLEVASYLRRANVLQESLKRIIDLSLAIPALIALLPAFAVIVFFIKRESQGPAFHREKRVGRWGRHFTCLKFRTMIVNGDSVLAEYLQSNPEAAKEWEEFRKLRGHDPRVTRVGRFLRRFSIDEMPQVLNIIRGEMSVIGPRPFLPKELSDVGTAGKVILSVKPGMAGMWIASGRNGLSFAERVKLEEYYVTHWGLAIDLEIFAKCLRALFTGAGAY